jgi:hypothetical protein
MKVEKDYVMLIKTSGPVQPGNGYVTEGWTQPGYLFKARRAERVEGVDYDAFLIGSIFVGQYAQWIDLTEGGRGPVPAEELFKYDVPMTIMQLGLDTTISFVNTSRKPQKFAVKLVGDLMR